ncbi:MAG: hypothetical protein DMG32_25390 [Acidobacteria bacterium]|nr:MAG: hypothetical protein DMG32_25390 [Acidobacteriota bacterium]
MFRIVSRTRRTAVKRFAAIGPVATALLLASPAFAQIGGDRVSSFLSNALSYAQSLGIFGAGSTPTPSSGFGRPITRRYKTRFPLMPEPKHRFPLEVAA